ncbi:hypothetical protein [Staphylococcus xylosus]
MTNKVKSILIIFDKPEMKTGNGHFGLEEYYVSTLGLNEKQ